MLNLCLGRRCHFSLTINKILMDFSMTFTDFLISNFLESENPQISNLKDSVSIHKHQEQLTKITAKGRKQQWKKYVRVQLAWHVLYHTGESTPTKQTSRQTSRLISSLHSSKMQILQLNDW